jgi:hypothetical protein
LAEVVTLAYATRALCKLERGGQPDSADEDLKTARRYLDKVTKEVNEANENRQTGEAEEKKAAKDVCEAACWHVEGLQKLDQDELDLAIEAFKKSVGLRARGTVYLRLAQAHLRAMSKSSDSARQYRLRLEAEEWCDRLTARDLAGKYDQRVKALRTRLDSVPAPENRPPTAPPGPEAKPTAHTSNLPA